MSDKLLKELNRQMEINNAICAQIIEQKETIRCQQIVLDQTAQALGLEPGDVDGIGSAIEELKRNYAHIEAEWLAQINRNTMLLGMIENPPVSHNQFHVLAGKFEADGEENIKFADSFNTLADAISAAESSRGYHFCRIEYQRWKLITEEMTKALAAGEAGK